MSAQQRRVRLFEPISLRELEVSNRLWMAPMCQYSAVDGTVQPWHLVHLGAVASGMAGMVVTEATAVSPEGRISTGDAGLWHDGHAAAWRAITDFCHSLGSRVAVQLAHAGRKASTHLPAVGRGSLPDDEGGWTTVGPSAVPFGRLTAPRALAATELGRVVDDFAAAARRAVTAGFDAVEIHAAHGYLLHSFLSPLANLRNDAHGGTISGRSKLLLDVIDAVRAAIPHDMPVLVRISATDWVEGGWSVADSCWLAPRLVERGADLIDVSSGGLDHRQRIEIGPGYQVPLAREVRAAVDAPVSAVGLITQPEHAEAVLRDGAADAVMLGRQLLREPRFVLRAAAELGAELPWPSMLQTAKYAGSIP